MIQTKLSSKKRMKNILYIIFFILFLLISRLFYLQIIENEKLLKMAQTQQTMDRKINPKRGKIYDRNKEKILSESINVESVTINPGNIKKKDKEKVAKKLSELFELDYEKTLKKVKKRSSIENIKSKVEKEKVKKLRKWMSENKILSGINIDEDSKRIYPNNGFASQIIGFCGSDNQGLDGVEARYDEELRGKKGYIQKYTNARGEKIGTEGEKYIAAQNGNDIVLTIDYTIQSIVEKHLKEACIDNMCENGGNVIAMNPKNGDILAMATYPNYNLNKPFEPYDEEVEKIWENMDKKEKNKYLQGVWRNRAIADTYEPGSVFKIITAAAALEEKITDTDREGEFNCSGGIEIAGVRIKCWRYYRPHGPESLRKALMNSCNPVFIGLGQKIGVNKYYEYLRKFKLMEKTKVDLPGEANSIFLKETKAGPIELATISFGQRFEITPIQLITAISSIANEGKMVKPKIVKKIIDGEGKEKIIEDEVGDNIISKETSEKVLSMMESVVSEGTGKNAKVEGYRIGGKTGTSEDGVNTNKFVASFCGVAPTNNPKIVLLVTLYNPKGEGGHQGGGVAAPLAGNIFKEVLPYLKIEREIKEVDEQEDIIVPNIIGLKKEEADKILKENKLEFIVENEEEIEEKVEMIVENQTPNPGTKIKKHNKILYKVKR